MTTPEMNTGFSALPSESAAPNRPSNRIRN
jgi:hypothetical protein